MGSSSDPDQEEGVSTSSDEDLQLAKKSKNKRERKHYRPQDDDEVFDLEDSEDFSCTSEDSSEEERSKNHKRRKSLSLSLKAEGESDVDPSENYDEDEVALQQAIALSMADRDEIGNSERLASNSKAGPSRQKHPAFDAEDEAMKQAMAYSLSDQSPLALAEKEETQLRGRIQTIDLAEGEHEEGNGKSRAVKINNRVAGKGGNTQSRKGGKPAFPAPSLEMVQQAFQMLDPTGSGILNPIALREVASKLLHKDLDDDQLDAMMEFADTMSHSEAESSSPDTRLVDAEAFCRLVARFASPE